MSEPTLSSRHPNPFDALKTGDATLRMLLVGIDGYRHLSSLNFAVADCQGLTGALLESSKGFPSRVPVSIVGDREISLPVTLDSIEQGFEQLLSGVQPQDTVLIYFSGHGDLDESTEELYLCLTETRQEQLSETALSVKQLLQRLKDSGASSQVLILDTCHSGGIVPRSRRGGEPSDSVRSPGAIECEDHPEFTPRLAEILNQHASPSREFCALLSCQATQLSWEFSDLGHGAFTYYLMEGLQSSAETADRLGRIDVESLYDYVRLHTNELVLKRHGKQQTPSRIVSGSSKIFVGARNPNRSLEERRNFYKNVVRNLLRQSYQPNSPITEEVADQLEHIADLESVPPQSKSEIEANEIRDLQDELNLYQERISRWLHQNHPQDLEQFCSESRTALEFDSRITSSFDAAARELFQLHKHEYAQKFRQFKYQESESYPAVRSHGVSLRFSDSVLDYLEEEINEEFTQSKLVYSGKIRQILRHKLGDNISQIKYLQEEIQEEIQEKSVFCDRIFQEVIDQERQLLEKDTEAYCQYVRNLFHEQNKPDLEALKILQIDFDLCDETVEEIQAQEEQYLDQHCEQYRQQYAGFIRKNEELSPDTLDVLKKLSVELGFNSPTRKIIEAIEQEEKDSCKQSLWDYRQTLTEIILQEGPLNLDVNPQLEKAEAIARLGKAWIISCQKEVIAEFEDGEKLYAREYAAQIRKSNALTDAGRILLRAKQAKLELGDLIAKTIESREDSNLTRDKEQYQRSFRHEIRQRSIPSDGASSDVTQSLRQKQVDLNLGDDIIHVLEFNEYEALAKDKKRYRETVVNELDREYPLSVISKRDLEKKQEELELCDEVAQQIEKLEAEKYHAKKAAQQEYKLEFFSTIRRYNLLAGESLSEEHRKKLDEYCRRHGLDIQHIQQIEQYFVSEYKKRLQNYQSTYQKELEKELIDREMLDRLIEHEDTLIDRTVAKSIESDVDRNQKSSMGSFGSPVKTTIRRSKDYVVQRSHQLLHPFRMGAICLLGIGIASGGTIALIPQEPNQVPESIGLSRDSSPSRSNFLQELLKYSTADVLSNAKLNYTSGKFEMAIAGLKAIPEGSEKSGDSQATLKKWKEEWNANKVAFEKATAAKTAGQWETVKIEGGKINHPVWKSRISPLLEQATEKLRPIPKVDETVPSPPSAPESAETPPTAYQQPLLGSPTEPESPVRDSGRIDPPPPPQREPDLGSQKDSNLRGIPD